MRKGQNPLKYKAIPALPNVVAAVITHLPNQQGYHAERLEVVKASLLSMRKHSDAFILVWDNGSCAELRAWLTGVFKPDQLVLSPNIGKTSAMAAIFGMFPPTTIIACADDDILYYPGWLEAQLEVIDRFPPAVVSGYPVRPIFQRNNRKTLDWGKASGELRFGHFIPDEWMLDYAKSIGLDVKKAPEGWKNFDERILYNGMMVYATSQHCQFVARVKDFAQFTHWVALGSADESKLDAAIDDAGVLRLTTNERYTRHMGNVLDADLRRDIAAMQLQPIRAVSIWEPGITHYEGVGVG